MTTTPKTDALLPFVLSDDAINDPVQAIGEVLLHACSSEKGMLHPWKPFDVAQVSKWCIAAYESARTPSPSVTSEELEAVIGKPMGDLMAMDRQGGISYSPHALAQVAAQAILTAFHVTKKEG